MNREQMIAWLTLEGWRLYLLNDQKTMFRVAKEHPTHRQKIWQWTTFWRLCGAGDATEYSEVSWDTITYEVLAELMEAMNEP